LQSASRVQKHVAVSGVNVTTTTTPCPLNVEGQRVPTNMDGQHRSTEHSVTDCQQRCETTTNCAYFSFWPDGGCHLQDASAQFQSSGNGAVTGPAQCTTTTTTVWPQANWVLGGLGKTCNEVCYDLGSSCSHDYWGELDTADRMASMQTIVGRGACNNIVADTNTGAPWVCDSMFCCGDGSCRGNCMYTGTGSCSSSGHSHFKKFCPCAPTTTTTASTTTTTTATCPSADYAFGKRMPEDMVGQGRSQENSAQDCQQRCRSTTDCAYFSFWPDGGCHLQDASAEYHTSETVVTGPAQCIVTSGTTTTTTTTTCTYAEGQRMPEDMDGQDRSQENSAEDCQQRCATTTNCAYFSFWPDGGCHLQDASAQLQSSGNGAVTGPAQCTTTTTTVWPQADWVLGGLGQTCISVCSAQGKTCSDDYWGELDTADRMASMQTIVGRGECNNIVADTNAGAPWICDSMFCCGDGSCRGNCMYTGTGSCSSNGHSHFKKLCPCAP